MGFCKIFWGVVSSMGLVRMSLPREGFCRLRVCHVVCIW